MLILRNAIGDDDLVDCTSIDSSYCVPTEDAVGKQSVDVRCTFFKSFAARVIVFDVSAKSSMRIATRLETSPTSIIVAFWRSVILVGRRS